MNINLAVNRNPTHWQWTVVRETHVAVHTREQIHGERGTCWQRTACELAVHSHFLHELAVYSTVGHALAVNSRRAS